jgi:hypothetical protein
MFIGIGMSCDQKIAVVLSHDVEGYLCIGREEYRFKSILPLRIEPLPIPLPVQLAGVSATFFQAQGVDSNGAALPSFVYTSITLVLYVVIRRSVMALIFVPPYTSK